MSSTRRFVSWNEVPAEQVEEGVTRQIITGERVMHVRYVIQPGFVRGALSHHHPEEMIAHVLQGTLEFICGDEVRIMKPGDLCVVPSDVPHGARVIGDEPVVVIDTFGPIRRDYL